MVYCQQHVTNAEYMTVHNKWSILHCCMPKWLLFLKVVLFAVSLEITLILLSNYAKRTSEYLITENSNFLFGSSVQPSYGRWTSSDAEVQTSK